VLVLRQKKAVMGALANRYESSICQYRIQQQRQDHSEERLLIMKKERFPQPKNFKLYKCDLPAAIGVMDNMYCIIQVPTTVAEKMLPKGLHLAEQDLTPKRMHPIMFFFTHNKFRLYPKTEYRELLVGVPFVDTDRKYNGYLGTYTYMPRLYLNRYLPRILGNRLYGYEKQAAIIEDDGCGTFTLRNRIDRCLLAKADFELEGNDMHPKSVEDIDTHINLFHMPFITQASRKKNPDIFMSEDVDNFLVSWIDYSFDHETALITPISGSVEIGHLFTPISMPRGVYKVDSIKKDRLGAFRIQVRQQCSHTLPIEKFETKDWNLAFQLLKSKNR
jgi:hypothetical protein